MIRQAYLHWLARGERVMGVVDSASLRDAGITPKHYWEANQALLTGAEHWPGITPDIHQNVVASDVVMSPGTHVTRSAIGAGASIGANLTLDGCVIWPNASITTNLTNAIALPDGTLLAIAD